MGHEPTDHLDTAEASGLNAALASAEAGRSYLAGTTTLSLDERYGSQIEYLSPDGRSFLWFPGQIQTTPGHWRVERARDNQPRMCFLYGAGSYDPVQKDFGGSWECGPLALYLAHLSQLAKGDPLGLRDGMAPFPMPSLPYALDIAQAQAEAEGKVSQHPLSFIFDRFKH